MDSSSPAGATVLVAGTAEAIATAKYTLGPDFAYLPAYSVDHAISLLSEDIDAIVCNVDFDDSRMFDFIHAARQSSAARLIPIICFRHHARPLSRATRDAIELALSMVAQTCFVDLYSITEKAGLSHALMALRGAVLNTLGIESHVSLSTATDRVFSLDVGGGDGARVDKVHSGVAVLAPRATRTCVGARALAGDEPPQVADSKRAYDANKAGGATEV